MPAPPEDLLRAAQGGDAESMHELGCWYLEGFDEGHFDEAADLSRLDEEEKARWTAQRHLRDEAFRWLAAAAEKGDGDAAATLADLLGRSGSQALRARAVRFHEIAAEKGDTQSMVSLAEIFEHGAGVPADPAAAQRWYGRAAAALEQAARRDDEYAPFALGTLAGLCLHGRGVARDAVRAVSLYEEAAARGNGWAMVELGDAFERGDGVPRDLARAAGCFTRAVEASGDHYARERLQQVQEASRLERDTERVGSAQVPRALLRAAEAGDIEAMSSLARALADEGEEAGEREWLEKAALAGHAASAFMLYVMTPAHDEAGRAAARAWRRRAAAAGHLAALQAIGDELLDPDAGAADPALGYAWLVMATRERHGQPPHLAAHQRSAAAARVAQASQALSAADRAAADAIIARCDAGPPFRLPDEVPRD